MNSFDTYSVFNFLTSSKEFQAYSFRNPIMGMSSIEVCHKSVIRHVHVAKGCNTAGLSSEHIVLMLGCNIVGNLKDHPFRLSSELPPDTTSRSPTRMVNGDTDEPEPPVELLRIAPWTPSFGSGGFHSCPLVVEADGVAHFVACDSRTSSDPVGKVRGIVPYPGYTGGGQWCRIFGGVACPLDR